MRTLLLLAGLLLLAQAQAPYAVEGVARYRGYYPLGSWEGVNPTPRGEVLWDGREKAAENLWVLEGVRRLDAAHGLDRKSVV